MPFTAPKLSRSIVAAAVVLGTSSIASSARAGMVVLKPIVFTTNVGITYSVAATGVGKLAIKGIDRTTFTDADSVAQPLAAMTPNSFSLCAFFDLSTGKLLNSYAGTSLTVTGERTLGTLETFYKATRIIAFDCVLNPMGTSSTFDFMWQKDADAGIFANASPHPFIGTTVSSISSLMNSTKSAGAFATQQSLMNNIGSTSGSPAVGTVLFQSNSSIGEANTFMTPTPQALGGGIVLLASAALRRRRSPSDREA